MPAVKKTSPVWPQDDCARPKAAAGLLVLASGLFLRTRQQLDDRIDRVCLREIGSTLESRLDQAADDFRATDRLAMFQTDVNGQTIEIGDMTVEQDDPWSIAFALSILTLHNADHYGTDEFIAELGLEVFDFLDALY